MVSGKIRNSVNEEGVEVKNKKQRPDISYEILYAEPFIQKDFDAVSGLVSRIFGETLTVEQFERVCTKDLVIVARGEGDTIIGFVSLIKTESLAGSSHNLGDIAVPYDLLGAEVAEKLVQKLIEAARVRGIQTIFASTHKAAFQGLLILFGFKGHNGTLVMSLSL